MSLHADCQDLWFYDKVGELYHKTKDLDNQHADVHEILAGGYLLYVLNIGLLYSPFL